MTERFTEQDLANLVRGAATTQCRGQPPLEEAGARAVQLAPDLTAQGLANRGWAFGASAASGAPSWDGPKAAVCSALGKMRPQELANRARSSSTMLAKGAQSLGSLGNSVPRALGRLSERDLAEIRWAIRRLACRGQPMLDALALATWPLIPLFDARGPANVVQASATSRQLEEAQLAASSHRAQEEIDKLTPQGPANGARAFGTPLALERPLLDCAGQAAACRMPEPTSQNLANIGWAHAALEHLRFPVFGATAGQAGRVNEEQGTANIAWRFAQLGLKEPRTQILVVNAQPLLPELTLQGPANAAQALCEPLPGKKASSRTAADIVLQKLQLSGHGESVSSDEPSAKDILSLSHALTVSGVLSLEAYAEMRRLLRRTAARLDESTFVPLPARSEGEVSWDQPRVLGYLGDGDVAVLWKPPNWTVSLGREDLEPDGAENGAAAGADGGLPLQDWVSATLGVRHAVCKDRSHDYGLAHRLDRFTSGAVLCATSYAGLYLTQLEFATRRVGKIYLALCVGLVRCNRLVEAPLSGGRKADGSWHSYVDTAGRTARTEILEVSHLSDGQHTFSLVEIRLHTGRQHQIRAHLASEGHALVGDSQYGGPVPQWCPRTFLHASRVALEGGEVTCPLPRDLLDALAKLEPCSKACRALKLRAQQEENPVL
ncbi:unnamed protein product [Effrenium voratum]|nr:unnamed protein product [Effrenium voratum]